MKRQVQFVLVCEDVQHEAFLLRLLRLRNVRGRTIRVERAPSKQNAEAWIRGRFPCELAEIRARVVNRVLVVMTDGDRFGVAKRRSQLAEACMGAERSVPVPTEADRVVLLVPTWNIETWLAYLDGMTVDETNPAYPRLDGHQRECQRQVETLEGMCRQGQLRQPAPPSLQDACAEVSRLKRLLEGV